MPTNKTEAIRLKPSDPRYFEIDLLQREIMAVVRLLIAENSVALGYTETTSADLDFQDKKDFQPNLNLAARLEELKQRQLIVLETNPDDYEPSAGIKLHQEFLNPRNGNSVNLEIVEKTLTSNEMEPWEVELRNSPMGEFIETLDFDKRMK